MCPFEWDTMAIVYRAALVLVAYAKILLVWGVIDRTFQAIVT